MDESLMLQVLTRLLTQLPLALVYVVGLALLFTRRPGRARTLGICGLAILLLALGLGLALWFVPMWLISQGHSYSSISSLLGIVLREPQARPGRAYGVVLVGADRLVRCSSRGGPAWTLSP